VTADIATGIALCATYLIPCLILIRIFNL